MYPFFASPIGAGGRRGGRRRSSRGRRGREIAGMVSRGDHDGCVDSERNAVHQVKLRFCREDYHQAMGIERQIARMRRIRVAADGEKRATSHSIPTF